jgi:aryl-alcohol dehydrogenase-like predicted oxidoreductase
VAAAATLAELRGWVPLAGIQVEFSLVQRTAERELLPMAEGLGMGVMGYSPLGGGVLTGKYRQGETGRASLLGAPTHSPLIDAVLDVLLTIAQEVEATPGQVATAWAMTRGVVPLVGARTRQQFDEQLRAAALRLSPEQLQRLTAASAVPLGYPHELLAGQQNLLTGNRADRVSWPTRPVA